MFFVLLLQYVVADALYKNGIKNKITSIRHLKKQ